MLFEGETRVVMYLESTNTEGPTFALVNSNILEPSSLIEIKVNKLILDCRNSDAKEGQIYKDKKHWFL